LLSIQATEVAEKFGSSDFKVSSRRLDYFKNRHTVFRDACGGADANGKM
jgi:hypothetical protein